MRTFEVFLLLCPLIWPLGASFGYWNYLRTWTYIEQPGRDADPNDTWRWSWDTDGYIYGSPNLLYSNGWASAETCIDITPDRSLGADAFAWSACIGEPYYRWVEANDSKALTAYVNFNLLDLWLEYWAVAVDRTWTLDAVAAAGGYGQTYCGMRGLLSECPGEWGRGRASTPSVTFAENDYDGFTPYASWAWSSQGIRSAELNGYLGCSGWVSIGPIHFSDSNLKAVEYLVLSTSVQGGCVSSGQLRINDPNFYWGGAGAASEYYIRAHSEISLVGNIR